MEGPPGRSGCRASTVHAEDRLRWSEGQRHLAEPPASPTPSPQLLPGEEEVLTMAVGERALNERRRTLDAPSLVPKDTVPRIVAPTHEEGDLPRP